MSPVQEEARHELPDPDRNLLLLVVLFTLVLAAWGILARVETIRIVPGRVIAEGDLQTVASPLGGRVYSLHVRPGMEVRAGDLLVELDSTAQGAELSALKVETMALEARRNRLQEGLHDRGVYGRESTGVTASAEAIAGSAHAAARSADTEAAQARVAESAERVRETTALLEGKVADLAAAKAELDVVRELVALRIEPDIALVKINARVSRLESDIAAARSGVQRARQHVKVARAELAALNAKLDSTAAIELADVTAAEERGREAIRAAMNRYEAQRIRAPVAGVVQRILPSGAGAFVQPGGTVVELVPTGGPFRVEARIPAEQIGFVHVGQKARVRYTAYDHGVHGSQEGRLVVLSPDSQIDPRTGRSFYLAQIEMQDNLLKSARGADLPISPGMTVDVVLVGEQRRVISYVTSPLSSFLQDALREP